MGAGPADCWPRTWTASLRLDPVTAVGPASAVGLSESAFQAVQRPPDGPTAARQSGCGGVGSGRWGCLGRRRTQGQRSRCPRPRPRMSPAWPAARPGLAAAGLDCGPGLSSKTSQQSDKGRPGRRPGGPGLPTPPGRQAGTWEPKCPESAQTPRPSQRTPSDSLESCGSGERRRAGEHRSCRIWTLPRPTSPTNRTRSSYLPNSTVISAELGEHTTNRRNRFDVMQHHRIFPTPHLPLQQPLSGSRQEHGPQPLVNPRHALHPTSSESERTTQRHT